MRTRPLLLSSVVLLLSLALLLTGCASKYGEQITKVNYYPQCYQPIGQLRADENAVAKSTAAGAAGGALIGALIGAVATGKAEGALAGAAAGGAAGAIGGNIYGKQQQKKRDAAFLAHYAQQLDADIATMTRVTAAAKVATNCYNAEFKRAVADYKARRITKKDLTDRYEEIRAGLQEVSYILTASYDTMAQKDKEYQAALADDYIKAPAKPRKRASKAQTQTISYKASQHKAGQQGILDQKGDTDGVLEMAAAEFASYAGESTAL